jgi:hypothetical protein
MHVRGALRTQFPNVCITREAAHAFSLMPRRGIVPADDAPAYFAPYDTPFGALRSAQLQALGLDLIAASKSAPLFFPPAPCADAGEERLLLDVARFVVAQGVFRDASKADCSRVAAEGFTYCWDDEAEDVFDFSEFDLLVRDYDVPYALECPTQTLADIGFFIDAQLRDAERRGQPLRTAFSLSGRTFRSVRELAKEHWHGTLFGAVDEGIISASNEEHWHCLASAGQLWRVPLSWDNRLLALLGERLRPPQPHIRVPNATWPAVVTSPFAAMDAVAGAWHMKQLVLLADFEHEGKTQRNCLRNLSDDARRAPDASYWSLRFTPDADALAALERTKHGKAVAAETQRQLMRLNTTLRMVAGVVDEVAGLYDERPQPEAMDALHTWATSGVGAAFCVVLPPALLGRDDGSDSDDGDDDDEEWGEDEEEDEEEVWGDNGE